MRIRRTHNINTFSIVEEKNKLFTSFSLLTNGRFLFSCTTRQSPSTISCFDGIRAISSLSLISSHYVFWSGLAIVNAHQQPPAAYTLQAYASSIRFAVDSFFVISGVLAAIKMLQDIQRFCIFIV